MNQVDLNSDLGESFGAYTIGLDSEVIRHVSSVNVACGYHETSGDIISDGIAFGAIQVPSSGQPIIMLADRQTTGGYTKIANVISADFRVLGQLKSGDRVRFEKISLPAAQEALLAQRASLRLLRHVLDG